MKVLVWKWNNRCSEVWWGMGVMCLNGTGFSLKTMCIHTCVHVWIHMDVDVHCIYISTCMYIYYAYIVHGMYIHVYYGCTQCIIVYIHDTYSTYIVHCMYIYYTFMTCTYSMLSMYECMYSMLSHISQVLRGLLDQHRNCHDNISNCLKSILFGYRSSMNNPHEPRLLKVSLYNHTIHCYSNVCSFHKYQSLLD